MTDLLLLMVGLPALLILAIIFIRYEEQGRMEESQLAYRLIFPRELTQSDVLNFVRSLAGLLPPAYRRPFGLPGIIFEVWADRNGITHRLRVPEEFADFVVAQLRTSMPGINVVPDEADYDNQPQGFAEAMELRLSNFSAPLRVDQPEAVSAAILSSLQPVGGGEVAFMQWALTPAVPRRAPSPSSSRLVKVRSSWLGFLLTALWGSGQSDREELKLAREKFAEPVFFVTGRLCAQATGFSRVHQLLGRLVAALTSVRMPGVTFRRRLLPSSMVLDRLDRGVLPLLWFPGLLSARELVALLGFPMGTVQVPGLRLGATKQLPPPAEVPSTGRVVARASFPGTERPLAISPVDSLRHMHVIGPTGVGKSTLLLNLITGDMIAGHGLAVLDPKGDLITDVLDRIPAGRKQDVILLDPSDVDRPVGLNLLAGASEAPELVTDQLTGIFHKLYAAFWGPRTDDILRAALLTLASEPGMTLCEVPLLLTNEGFRRRLTGRLEDPVALGPFWAWYEGMSDAERAQAIGPVMNKLRAFLLRRTIRNVIGQAEPSFDMTEVLANRKILLVPLPKGIVGEEGSALLGSLVMALLWQTAQGRASLPANARVPFFCYVDEFQDYLNMPTAFTDVLAQARGFGFSMTLAHQYLGQLPAAVRQGLANARTKVVFQTSADDARVLAREFAPYLAATDLQSLGTHEVVVAAAVGARVAPPASGVTYPPPPLTGHALATRAASRQRYGRDRIAVEEAIKVRHEGRPTPGPVGRRRRA